MGKAMVAKGSFERSTAVDGTGAIFAGRTSTALLLVELGANMDFRSAERKLALEHAADKRSARRRCSPCQGRSHQRSAHYEIQPLGIE